MSEKRLGFCGLDCNACPAYHAAERLTTAERQKTAEVWSKQYNVPMAAEDIDCVGCSLPEGRHVGYCAVCQIRLCALEKKVSTCAACSDYGCEKLEGFIKNIPDAKANLAALRT
jgi:hypothetical protein